MDGMKIQRNPEEWFRWFKITCAFPQAQDSPWYSPKLTICCVSGCFCHPRALAEHADVSGLLCLCWENQDILLCCQSPEHATSVTFRYMPAAKNFLLGDKANFVQTCSFSRLSDKFIQSSSTKSLTEAFYNTAMHLCASILALCSCHGHFDLQVAVCGLKFFLLLRLFYHPAQWLSEGRIIGGLTEFPWLGAYLNSRLVWMVSHCFLLFLILLEHRKRFWIAFFSQPLKAAF